MTHKVTTGPQRIDPSKGDAGPAALPRVEVLGGAPASLSKPSDWDAWRASEVAFRNVDRARLRKRLAPAEPPLAPGEVDGTVAPDSDDEFEDDLEIEEVAVSAEDMARLRAGGASDDDDDDLLVEEVQLSPEEVEKLRAGGDDDDDDLLVEEVQMSPEEVEKLRAGEESDDDDLQIEEVQMSPEEVEKLRAGEESDDDDLQIEEVQMSPEEVEKLRAGEESSDDDLQIEEVQMSPKEVERLREDAAKDELREKKAAKKKAAARPGGFAAGDRVEICGLVAAASRNGAKGTVERRAGARYAVVLDDGARLGAKPENLRRLADTAAPPAKPAKPAPAPVPAAAAEPKPAAPPATKGMWGDMVSDLSAAPDKAPTTSTFVPMSASRPFGFGTRRF